MDSPKVPDEQVNTLRTSGGGGGGGGGRAAAAELLLVSSSERAERLHSDDGELSRDAMVVDASAAPVERILLFSTMGSITPSPPPTRPVRPTSRRPRRQAFVLLPKAETLPSSLALRRLTFPSASQSTLGHPFAKLVFQRGDRDTATHAIPSYAERDSFIRVTYPPRGSRSSLAFHEPEFVGTGLTALGHSKPVMTPTHRGERAASLLSYGYACSSCKTKGFFCYVSLPHPPPNNPKVSVRRDPRVICHRCRLLDLACDTSSRPEPGQTVWKDQNFEDYFVQGAPYVNDEPLDAADRVRTVNDVLRAREEELWEKRDYAFRQWYLIAKGSRAPPASENSIDAAFGTHAYPSRPDFMGASTSAGPSSNPQRHRTVIVAPSSNARNSTEANHTIYSGEGSVMRMESDSETGQTSSFDAKGKGKAHAL